MRPITVIDAETDPFRTGRVPQPFLWGWYSGSDYRQFDKTADLAAFLQDRRELCYAHNGGKFDFHYLLPYIEAYSDLLIIDNRIVSMRIGECELRDSYAILPIPLSAYKKDTVDYAIFEPRERIKPANRAIIEKYLHQDCVYLHELVSKFIGAFGVRMTLAGAAMAEWQKISGPAPRTTGEFYDTLAPWYCGGRVECFESGIIDRDFEVYDINSAYPWAMMSAHPAGVSYTSSTYDPVADFYEVECDSEGAFPFRGERGGLSFPRDGARRVFHVTRHELEAAEDTGALRHAKILTSIRFAERVSFGEYVDNFFEMKLKARREGDIAGALMAKLLLNSLYGKFGANPDRYLNHRILPLEELAAIAASDTWSIAGQIGPWGLASRPLEEAAKRWYNVATGASITGQVRALLWRTIRASKGVLYCDTDSIAAASISEGADIGDALGAWKLEGQFYKAGIAGKKMYVFKGQPGTADKIASKGVRLTGDEIMEVAAGGEVIHSQDAPSFSIKNAPKFVKRKITQTKPFSDKLFSLGNL